MIENSQPQPFPWNPFDPAELADPYPSWARARRQQPVFYSPMLNAFIVTRYADILAVVEDTARFASRDVLYVGPVPAEVAHLLPNSFPWDFPTLVNSDPPAHTRIRKLCGQAFKPTAVAAWEPEIRAIADRLIDGFIAAGHVDFVSRFAEPLPGLVMCRLLDIADEDAPKFVGWVDHVVRLFDPALPKDERLAACRSSADFYAFCEEEIRRRRQTPQRDFITALIEARSDEGQGEPMLSQREVISVLSQILIGGVETVRRSIGNLVLLLLSHPEQLAAVREDASLIAPAIEESLRHTDAVKGLFRRTTCDVELGGVTIPSGALVMVMWASGNRDEQVFNSPDKFNIFRTDIDRHIAFSRGPHFCLGVPLARLELRVALERLLSRLPNLRRADQRPIEWVSSLTNRGPQRLDVTWGS